MWSIAFLINSFKSPLPWTISPEDKYYYHTDYNSRYFKYNLLESSNSIEETKYIVIPWFISLLVAWLLVYILIWRGIKSSGKFVYITTPLPFVILFILLIRGISLDGAMTGWKYLFNPDFTKLYDIHAWKDAISQIIFSLSLGNNTVLLYSSYRKQNERIIPNSVIIPIINLVTSIFAALVLFAYLGYMSEADNVKIDSFPISGIDLPFVVYPALISTLPGANAWSVIFFLMLIISGVNSLFPNVDSVISIFYGTVNKYSWNPGRCWVAIWYCIISCLFSIIFSSWAGYYLQTLYQMFP